MGTSAIRRPTDEEYAPFHAAYVALVPDGDVFAALARSLDDLRAMLRPLSDEKSRFRYAPGKWSIREVVSHMADSERVWSYRALRFARGDATPLPGFDEVAWGKVTRADRRPLNDLLDDLQTVRAATLSLFRGFTTEELDRNGVASNATTSVRGLLYVIAGHERHHMNVLKERYLKP